MTRVCCFCERWESGGIESFLTNVLTRFDPDEFEVDIVAAVIGESLFTERLRAKGVRFVELSGSRNRVLANERRFAELLRERRYDVVHVNAFHAGALGFLRVAERCGVKTRIAHSHNSALRRSGLWIPKQLVHNVSRVLLRRFATDFRACSDTAARFMFGRSASVIPNGIEVEAFRFNSAARAEIRGELQLEERRIIGNVGRLSEQKNQSFLLDVFAEAHRRDPKLHLLLVGDGELRGELQMKAERLGIGQHVTFAGNSDRVSDLLSAMDVFAFPSTFEGLGIAAVEAQASGLPVIASEHVPDEANVSSDFKRIPLSDKDAWVEAMLAPNGTDRADGVRSVRAHGYDIENTVRLVEAAYTA